MSRREAIDLSRLGIPEATMLGRYDYAEARDGLRPHAHPAAMEICYLAKGQQVFRVGERDFPLKGGDVFVAFPDETHSTGDAPSEKSALYWLILALPPPSQAAGFLGCGPEEGRALAAGLRALPHRHFIGEAALKRDLDELFRLSRRPPSPLARLEARHRLIGFLLRIQRRSQQNPRPSVSPKISGLLRHIEERADQGPTLASLARRAGLSLPRLKARFKQEVGMPPAEYVLRCRLERAKRSLGTRKASVTEIAYDLNFSSSQYFATVFRRYVGKSPTEYQEAMGRR